MVYPSESEHTPHLRVELWKADRPAPSAPKHAHLLPRSPHNLPPCCPPPPSCCTHSGTKLYDLPAESEATFHLVPVESGLHKFCLKVNYEKSATHYSVPRDVLWNINIGYSEGHDKVGACL